MAADPHNINQHPTPPNPTAADLNPSYYKDHDGARSGRRAAGGRNSEVGSAHRRTGFVDEDADANSHLFWHALIPETEAAGFCGLTTRTMQALRQRGGGPKFVRLSARCLRYRRADLKAWADQRLRASTAEAAA